MSDPSEIDPLIGPLIDPLIDRGQPSSLVRPEPALSRRHSLGTGSARSLLLTVLGEFVLPATEPVWTSALVDVLGGCGVEEKAARQALARTAEDFWIEPVREGRRVRWELTARGRRLLGEGAERIYSFAAEGPPWDGRWLVLSISVPESRRRLRHQVRTRMSWAGFGSPAPSLWVSTNPGREAEAKQILAELELDRSSFSFIGPYGDIGAARNVVAQAWDLDDVAEEYEDFLEGFSDVAPKSADEMLLCQVRLVHEWRRFPFLDPQLPADLLPPDWPGREAAALFRDLHGAWHEPAQRRWRDLSATD